MPFKRGAYYRIQIRHLPGFGPFPETSTFVRSMSIARQMESLVKRLAERGLEDASWHRLLCALRGGKRGERGEITLPELLKAHNEGTLDEMRFRLKDPELTVAVEEYVATGVDYESTNGLLILKEMARREFGPTARLSILRTGKNITKLCARAEKEGGRSRKSGDWDNSPLSRNTVYRGMRNAISKLCTFQFGPAARDQVFSAVRYSAADDTRDVFLDARQLERLLRNCTTWLRPLVLTAALTGADRKPLLRLCVRDVEVVHRVDLGLRVATLYLRDSKNESRPRSVTVVGPAADAIKEITEGRDQDDKVFQAWFDSRGRRLPITPDRLRRAFEEAREKAGFTVDRGWRSDLRFKDLRHTAGVAFESIGMGTTKIGAGLGHKRRETSLKYTTRQVQLDPEDAIKVAAHLGILRALPERTSRTAPRGK